MPAFLVKSKPDDTRDRSAKPDGTGNCRDVFVVVSHGEWDRRCYTRIVEDGMQGVGTWEQDGYRILSNCPLVRIDDST
jgi:hypothetical protein